jgi:hypothetical protein
MLDTADGAGAGALGRSLPVSTEAPPRERLRWEKELLGLYLSDHPLGELATEMGRYVNAWSGDVGEPLDQQRVVVGGMVVAVRRVITRNRESMAVATIEDLQGTVDVVVFPRTYAETGQVWREDAVLLVAGRVDHKGEETVVLADTVWTWEDAVARGPEAFGHEVAAAERGGGRGRRSGNGRWSNGSGVRGVDDGGGQPVVPDLVAVPIEAGADAGAATLTIPRISPLRGSLPDGTMTITVGGPVPRRAAGRQLAAPVRVAPASVASPHPPLAGEPSPDPTSLGEPPSDSALAGEPLPDLVLRGGLPPDDLGEAEDEPPLPEEVHAVVARAAAATTTPVEAGPGQTLHIRFADAPDERIVAAFAELRALIKSRPGATPVVLHIPAGRGRSREMRLGVGIAYDAELLAETERSFGSLLQLRLT